MCWPLRWIISVPSLNLRHYITNAFDVLLQSLGVAFIAERLSVRLLIVQCGQLAFVHVYIYIYIYIYPSHFNCVGAVSVVSSPDY